MLHRSREDLTLNDRGKKESKEMATKKIVLKDGESVNEAIERSDQYDVSLGKLPIVNFTVSKFANETIVRYDEYGMSIRKPSRSQSLRRDDDTDVELGIPTGTVGGQYGITQNMEVVEAFFPVHEEKPAEIAIWNSEDGKRCGVEAKTEVRRIGTEEWTIFTTVTNSFDLTKNLTTYCLLTRNSDSLRYPVTLPGGHQTVKHTSGAKIRYKTVAGYREKVQDVLEEQIALMSQFHDFDMNWMTFKRIMMKAIPGFNPNESTSEKGKNRREGMVAKIGVRCHGKTNALDFLTGFMEYLSQDLATRSCKGKDPEEVRFLSITDGDKFGKIQKVQRAVLDYIIDWDADEDDS